MGTQHHPAASWLRVGFSNMEKIGILGAGYVGLATAAGFAARGFSVVCADVNQNKLAILQSGELLFFEEGMKDVFRAATVPVVFTANLAEACACNIVFCCVGTPSAPDGSADLSYVRSAAETCASIHPGALFVIKSTVPPGTSKQIHNLVNGKLRIAANPEFLREGQAVHDALNPSRIVIGADDPLVLSVLSDLYSGTGAPIVATDSTTAELVKYASNSFLATKISFMNDIANLCDVIGADVQAVAHGMGLDDRIGPKFLQPGPGYGGSCFPKDVAALRHLGEAVGVPLRILKATTEVNEQRQRRSVELLQSFLGDLAGKKIAIWGLAFKPGTDDIRDAPSLVVIEACLKAGATVTAYDPLVRDAAVQCFPALRLASSALVALEGADALVIMTDWPEFSSFSRSDVQTVLGSSCIVDLRHVLTEQHVGNEQNRI